MASRIEDYAQPDEPILLIVGVILLAVARQRAAPLSELPRMSEPR